MARMINADALQELCNKRIKDTWNSKTAPVSWAEAYADFKDDINSIPAFAQPGKPLTLDQLREMDGQPVWIVEYPDWGHWELSEDANDYIVDRNLNFYGMKHDDPDGRYGLHKLGWLAYSYPPAQQRWIPVSDRLPDPLEDVLVKCKTSMGRSYECIAQYIAPGTAKDETDVEWDWEVLDYNEKRDVYVVQPGWYESVKNWDEYGLCGILDIVTHWMPLPEPPEEG